MYIFGWCYANLPTLWRRHVGGCLNEPRAWSTLNFDKEYLFVFETLIFVTSGILSIHKQLVTLKRERSTLNHIIVSGITVTGNHAHQIPITGVLMTATCHHSARAPYNTLVPHSHCLLNSLCVLTWLILTSVLFYSIAPSSPRLLQLRSTWKQRKGQRLMIQLRPSNLLIPVILVALLVTLCLSFNKTCCVLISPLCDPFKQMFLFLTNTYFTLSSKCILIQECLDIYTRTQVKNTE